MKRIQKLIHIFPAVMVVVMLFNLAFPFNVHAQDETPAQTPPAPAETETQTETPPVVELTAEPTPVAEVILTEAPQGTDLVVVDSSGETLPVDSQEAAQIIAAVDPMWCPEGSLPNDTGCSTNMTPLDLIEDMRAHPEKYSANGVIYFDNSSTITSPFVLDDSDTSLGTSFNFLNIFNLNLFGGWNGGSTNTFEGQTIFSGPNAFLRIGDLLNPWFGSVALNNIRVNGSEISNSGIEINASNVDLTNVESSYNAGDGIVINAPDPGNVNLNDVTASNNGLGSPDSAASGVVIHGNDTTVNVAGGRFNNNPGFGIEASNSISTTIPQGNLWTDADDYAPGSTVTISGGDNSLNGELLGFTPDEMVHVDVSGPNGYTAECDGVADSLGKWSCQIELWDSNLAIGSYTYTANGLTSGITVSGSFTDAMSITSATLNGGSSVTVDMGASITAAVTVALSGPSRWRATGWRISTAEGAFTCVNTPNHNSGTNTESFTITAPSAAGTYNAYFRAYSNNDCSGAASATYTMTNAVVVNKVTPTITWANPADIPYGTALSGTQLNATASVPGSFTYTPSLGTVLNAGNGQTLHVDFIPTDTTNYNTASANVTINVLKADATCTISGFTGTYDGAAHGASGSCTGSGTLDLGASFSNVPGGTANWTYSGGTNYNDQSGSVAIVITQAASSVTVTCPASVVYSGSAIEPCTAAYSGAGGLSGSLTPSYTDNTNVGTATASASYAGDANHSPSSNSATFEIIAGNTPPVLSLPTAITAEATGSAGAAVTYNATATDMEDGSLTPTCSLASGSTFAIATTTVTCSVTDSGGLADSGSFTITVQDSTPPTIDAHADIGPVEAIGSTGAPAIYSNPATHDAVDGDSVAVCLPTSASTFAMGTNTVTCTKTDSHGNTALSTFQVSVVDTFAPIIDAHADVTVEATSPSGAVVSYTNPTTLDIVDGVGVATCTPAPSSTFIIGDTNVTCSAADTHLNAATPTSFVVHVVDTTAPVIDASADITTEATGPTGADVIYASPSTHDAVDGDGVATCTPASGSPFIFGDTTVSCNATDAHSNPAPPASFVIHVVDTTGPSLILPANMTVVATSAAGSVVNFSTSATDSVDGIRPVVCFPASGSTFPIATTNVDCATADSRGNSTIASFTVTVLSVGTTAAPTPTPAPRSISIIPLTGGQTVSLACGSRSTLRTPHGIEARFLVDLCGYQAIFNEKVPESLPGTLTGVVNIGITLQIILKGDQLELLPKKSFVQFVFPMLQNSKAESYTVLLWDAGLNNGIGEWIELPITPGRLSPGNPLDLREILNGFTMVNGIATFTVNFPGTFVIVSK